MQEQNQISFQSIQNYLEIQRETYNFQEQYFLFFFQQQQVPDPSIQTKSNTISPPIKQKNKSQHTQQLKSSSNLQQKQAPVSFQFPSLNSQNQQQKHFQSNQQQTESKPVKRTRKILKPYKKKGRNLSQTYLTRNACFNILQKAISIIHKGEYEGKLQQICRSFGIHKQNFKTFAIKERIKLTGLISFKIFLKEQSQNNSVFCSFLKWFLEEKYIRHAIKSGKKSDLKAYIKFKNQVMLPLL